MNSKIKRIILVFLAVITAVSCMTFSSSAKAKTNADIVKLAMKYEGYPYVYGAAGPDSFDCSGFVMYIYAQFGISLPHNATEMYLNGEEYGGTYVSAKDAQPGDIIGWEGGHAAIYIGNGKMINALSPSYGVCISGISTFRNKYGVTCPPHTYLHFDLSKVAKQNKESQKKKLAEKEAKKAEKLAKKSSASSEQKLASLENSFSAYIGRNGKYLTETNGVVTLSETEKSQASVWHFEKQSDGTYTITAGTSELFDAGRDSLDSVTIYKKHGAYYFSSNNLWIDIDKDSKTAALVDKSKGFELDTDVNMVSTSDPAAALNLTYNQDEPLELASYTAIKQEAPGISFLSTIGTTIPITDLSI